MELPDDADQLRLASADHTVQPIIDYRYFHNDNDIRRMRDAVRLAAKSWNQTPQGRSRRKNGTHR